MLDFLKYLINSSEMVIINFAKNYVIMFVPIQKFSYFYLIQSDSRYSILA